MEYLTRGVLPKQRQRLLPRILWPHPLDDLTQQLVTGLGAVRRTSRHRLLGRLTEILTIGMMIDGRKPYFNSL